MVNQGIINAKLTELAGRIGDIRGDCPASFSEFEQQRVARNLTSFNLMLAVQSCVDIASHIIADEGWPMPLKLADGFEQLRERGVISEKSAKALQSAVGLRNIVAHGYAGIDQAKVHSAAIDGVRDLDLFAQEIAQWVAMKTIA